MIVTSVTSGSYAPLLARADRIERAVELKSSAPAQVVIQPQASPPTADTVSISTAARTAYFKAAQVSSFQAPAQTTIPERIIRDSYLSYSYLVQAYNRKQGPDL